VNQGPRGYCLMTKMEGQKSRDTVPLRVDTKVNFFEFAKNEINMKTKFISRNFMTIISLNSVKFCK
jgi:hypothetical protein